MKLAISNIAWEQSQDEKMYGILREKGIAGLEIAPTRIFPENPYDQLQQARDWRKRIEQDYGLCVPSMQSIWYGRTEKLFGTDRERRELFEYTKKAIDFAQVIGCGNLVFGCPKNRNVPEDLGIEAATEITEEFFSQLGAYAAACETVLSMEANPTIYHTNFINTTEEAIVLVEKIGSRGFRVNFDLGTVIANGESLSVLEGKFSCVNHVHMSEPGLGKIVERGLHRELMQLICRSDYEGFWSVEMGRRDTVSEIVEVMDYVKKIVEGQ